MSSEYKIRINEGEEMSNWFQAPLSFVIRYLFPGLVILLYYQLYTNESADKLYEAFTSPGKLVLFALVGFFLYLVYRPFVYNPFVPRIQDHYRRKSDNYRTYLVKKFSPQYHIETKEAQFLYHEIKRSIGPYSEEMQVVASCIHLLYISGLSGILGSIIVAIIWLVVNTGNYYIVLSIFITGWILLFAGFFSDKYYETVELGIIKRFDADNPDKLNSIANSLLAKRTQEKDS